MLTRLRVKNYALIEDLDTILRRGLNILTGATGAGKSILIGSMNLILGEKASLEMVRSGTEEAFVEATFELTPPIPKTMKPFLSGDDGFLILRRQVIRGGRSYAFVNDRQVTLAKLKEIGDALADLLGQHHHQSLLNSNNHRQPLDHFSLDSVVMRHYGEAFSHLRDSQKELKEILEREQLAKERRELYRFQLDEIDKAQLQPDEETSLLEERIVLRNVQKISDEARKISHGLSEEEDSVLGRLQILLKEFTSLTELDGRLKEKLAQWQEAVYSLEDVALELNRYGDSIEANPERLAWIEDRLRLYADFAKKYGKGYNEIIAYQVRIRDELNSLENRRDRIRELSGEIEELKHQVHELGRRISEARLRGAAVLKEKIEKELQEMGMKGTKFDVAFTPFSNAGSGIVVAGGDDSSCLAGEFGLEEVEFLISPNPGEPLKPLAKIASGGEMSRIMLALKTVLAKIDRIPLLVFDEIDVGIGGDIATLVGRKLKKLSQHHQIICITHLQQIASYADAHFQVVKREKGGRTVTEVMELSQEERVAEIARMIAGEEITELSLEHAREFLRGSAEA